MNFTQKSRPGFVNQSIPKESQEQIRLAHWLTKNNILFYHCPNGGMRNMAEAVKLKAMGVRKGVPDICVPIARSHYHGLYIELKRLKGGGTTDEQKYWLEALRFEGYYAAEVRGAEAAIELINYYLTGEMP